MAVMHPQLLAIKQLHSSSLGLRSSLMRPSAVVVNGMGRALPTNRSRLFSQLVQVTLVLLRLF